MRKGLTKTLSITAAILVGVSVLGGVTLFATTSMPTQSIAADKTLSGQVMYRERIALPPEAHLTVQLSDVSRADAPAIIIGQTKIDSVQGAPIPFAINFDTSKIEPGHTYALQARISAGDTLWFVNDERYSINPTKPEEPIEIKVVMVRNQTEDPVATGIEGSDWLVEDIKGAGVVDTAQTTLTVQSDGSVNGSGGCNRYFGKATISGQTISFGPMGATYMACPPAIMDQERKFLTALENTQSYRIDQGKLVLLDKSGDELAKLSQSL